MARTFTIGDIHGGRRALQQVLDKVGLKQGDRLIFLGDYVDGWSESRQVIELLMELDDRHDCIFILGNHDAWCEEWLMGWGADRDWVLHGGQATIDSYAGISPADRERHLRFFRNMRPYYEDNNCLFIHAGFSSMHGPKKRTSSQQLFMGQDAVGDGAGRRPAYTKNELVLPPAAVIVRRDIYRSYPYHEL